MEEKNKKQNEAQEKDNKIPIERINTAESPEGKETVEVEQIEAELKSVRDKVSELEKQNAELKDSLLRKVAEFENFKRRNENDQLNLLKYAAESFIKNILPVYDDLERSLAHIDDESSTDSTKKGLLLVLEKFGKILESQGIKRIDAKGKPFDVEFHEALMQQPVEGVAPHTVLDVIEQGYMYKDKVIRHAKVIVSAESASHDEHDAQNGSNQEG
jgi:molecular chaperone GrpE